MEGLPAAHCRVVASLAEGDDAFVVIDTGPAGHPYLDGATVRRVDGGWVGGSSGNGAGWTLTEGELGTLHVWGEAPAGAEAVRVEWGGEVREAPVRNGVYLVAWWRVPCPEEDDPQVAGFRMGGRG